MRGEIEFSCRGGSKAGEVQLLGEEMGKSVGTRKDGKNELSMASQMTLKVHALRRLAY